MIWKVIKSSYEKGAFDEIGFAKEYEKLGLFFYSEKTTLIQILVPIYNLKIEHEYLDISSLLQSPCRLTLRSMTNEEKKFLISVVGGYSSERIIAIQYSLELEYYEKFHSKDENLYEMIRAQISELITALRLLKKEYVWASLILFRPPLIDKTVNLIPIDYDLFSLVPIKIKDGNIFSVKPYLLIENEQCELIYLSQELIGLHHIRLFLLILPLPSPVPE